MKLNYDQMIFQKRKKKLLGPIYKKMNSCDYISHSNCSGPLILKAEPSISLSLNVQEKSECTSLHWDETKGHR